MTVRIERNGKIGIVTVGNPPVNALSRSVRQGLLDAAEEFDRDPDISIVLLTCAGRTFIAGADISEFDRPPVEPHLPDVVRRIETAEKPWIAAIHGAALGGGLELALGCAWRLAAASASLGFPEVNLGLVPGAGGCARAPRLIGAEQALELVTSGRPVSALKARELGLVDAVVEGDFRKGLLSFARAKLDEKRPIILSETSIEYVAPIDWNAKENSIKKKARGAIAPLRALECIKAAVTVPVNDALDIERETFLELRESAQSRALRHVFFAERNALKPDDLKGAIQKPVKTVGVVGAGTMGTGIACCLRDAGFQVVLLERDRETLDAGLKHIQSIYEAAAKRGRMTEAAVLARMAGVRGVLSADGMADTDLVIEAVFEDLDLKRSIFKEISDHCHEDTILATNTSYLDSDLIFEGVTNQDRTLGLHFCSPANVMKLVEVVPTRGTSRKTAATGYALVRALRKIPVRSGICDGFIGNRLLKILRLQAEKLLLAGAKASEIDSAMKAYGLAMGPFEAQDLAGLDVAAMQRAAARERRETVFAPISDRLVEEGRLGQKSRAGWYDYPDGSRLPNPSNHVQQIVAEEQARCATGTLPAGLALAEAVILPMVNEAAQILEEGVASSASDIDLVMIHGYGHPRWRGGLLFDAEQNGLDDTVRKLEILNAAGLADGPCERLKAAAKMGHF
ncbi:3-hydroxyacyl-CoA dehydrogenase [Roseibium sp. RKSG952]|nr:3-hydroxyacyl-CoA dehydrogenase NAD-binding domain-containing protein [Roseibium sp. RKSG952]MTH98246.1 3-hydroxyacyl-CoA dehydrogenase [Roseibium sp. RKSG952]